VHVAVVLHRCDVGTGGKCFFAAGDDDGADAVVGVARPEGVAELRHEVRTERVELLSAIERDKAGAPPPFHGDERVGHRLAALSADSGTAAAMSMPLRPGSTATSASLSSTTVSLPGKPCTRQLSWTLAPSSTTMRPKSPRRHAQGRMWAGAAT